MTTRLEFLKLGGSLPLEAGVKGVHELVLAQEIERTVGALRQLGEGAEIKPDFNKNQQTTAINVRAKDGRAIRIAGTSAEKPGETRPFKDADAQRIVSLLTGADPGFLAENWPALVLAGTGAALLGKAATGTALGRNLQAANGADSRKRFVTETLPYLVLTGAGLTALALSPSSQAQAKEDFKQLPPRAQAPLAAIPIIETDGLTASPTPVQTAFGTATATRTPEGRITIAPAPTLTPTSRPTETPTTPSLTPTPTATAIVVEIGEEETLTLTQKELAEIVAKSKRLYYSGQGGQKGKEVPMGFEIFSGNNDIRMHPIIISAPVLELVTANGLDYVNGQLIEKSFDISVYTIDIVLKQDDRFFTTKLILGSSGVGQKMSQIALNNSELVVSGVYRAIPVEEVVKSIVPGVQYEIIISTTPDSRAPALIQANPNDIRLKYARALVGTYGVRSLTIVKSLTERLGDGSIIPTLGPTNHVGINK